MLGLFAGSPAGLVSTATFAQTPESQLPVGATATLRDVSSRTIANVEFRGGQAEVFMNLTFATGSPLKLGSYGLAVTQNGNCLAPAFTTAGAVFNPSTKPGASAKTNAPLLGQLPSLVYSQGLTRYTAVIPGATLLAGMPTSLIGMNGQSVRSVVLYDGPAGQGSPIACGSIVAPQATSTSTTGALTTGVVQQPVAAQPALRPLVPPTTGQTTTAAAPPAATTNQPTTTGQTTGATGATTTGATTTGTTATGANATGVTTTAPQTTTAGATTTGVTTTAPQTTTTGPTTTAPRTTTTAPQTTTTTTAPQTNGATGTATTGAATTATTGATAGATVVRPPVVVNRAPTTQTATAAVSVSAAQAQPPAATADLKTVTGQLVGTVELRPSQGQVLLSMTLANPNPLRLGSYGLAITQSSGCTSTNFSAAGDVFDPSGKQRASAKSSTPMLGQLPDLVYSQGLTLYTAAVTGATLLPGTLPTLIGLNGASVRSIVLYDGPTLQAAAAGGETPTRIACGAISLPRTPASTTATAQPQTTTTAATTTGTTTTQPQTTTGATTTQPQNTTTGQTTTGQTTGTATTAPRTTTAPQTTTTGQTATAGQTTTAPARQTTTTGQIATTTTTGQPQTTTVRPGQPAVTTGQTGVTTPAQTGQTGVTAPGQPVLPGVTAPAQTQPGVVAPPQPAVNPPAAIVNHDVFQPAGLNTAQSPVGPTTAIGIAGAGVLLIAGGYLLRRRRARSA